MTDAPDGTPWPVRPDPSASGLLRASDADRDAVARTLAQAFAEGRLGRDEHDDRLSRALAARTTGELANLTLDLPKPAQAASKPDSWSFGAPRPGEGNAAVVSIFGGSKRAGHWFVPGRVTTFTIFGGTELDLRDATFTSPVVDIDVVCLFGGLTVVVPENVRVETQVVSVFGGCDTAQTSPRPGAPVVRLRGLCLFGGVNAKVKRRRSSKAPTSEPPVDELR